jgi:hypothetical protein
MSTLRERHVFPYVKAAGTKIRPRGSIPELGLMIAFTILKEMRKRQPPVADRA